MVLNREDKNYKQCSISVMDNIADPNINFDTKGISNYYYEYKEKEKNVYKGQEGKNRLEAIVKKIKDAGKGKKYDCITGVSGGVDSTYVALQMKKLGLNPLIVHFDNGWNSELAVKNIENIINRLGFDLYTLVVDWNEFKDIQLSFIKASVVDIETITDHAIIATLYKLAVEKNIKYVISGSNIVTEATLPGYWIFNKTDHVNIIDIHKKFGSVKLKTFPFFNTRLKKQVELRGIENFDILNNLPYIKSEVKSTIINELGWRDYGGKHYESIFTRFYQGFILPEKFHIDKRKAHLSNLIFSGQISKKDALEELDKPIYDAEQLKIDKEFVLKKLELSNVEFENLMKKPRVEHDDFATEKSFYQRFPALSPLRPVISFTKRLLTN
jgi:N-acetyl sugar amidotransferase